MSVLRTLRGWYIEVNDIEIGTMPDSKEKKCEEFLKLFKANEERIYRLILALVPNYTVAEEIMQDAMLVMWRKFDQFEIGTSFAAWGMQISRFIVYKFYREKNKSIVVNFNSDAMNNILKNQYIFEEDDNLYLESLQDCFDKLHSNHKELISLRYENNMKITDIALKIGKTFQATYKIMSRIHHVLYHCIERNVRTSRYSE